MNMFPRGPIPEDADDRWWAAQDYFWALGAGLLVRNSRTDWRMFLAGYAPPRGNPFSTYPTTEPE